MARWLFYYVENPSDKITGGGRSVRNLILGLRDNRGIDPVFVSQCEGGLSRQLANDGVHVRTVPLPDRLDVYDKKALDYSLADKARSVRALLHYNGKVQGVAHKVGADGIWARGARGVLQVGFAAWWNHVPLVWDVTVEQHPQGMVWMLHTLSLLLSDRVVTEAKALPEIVLGSFLSEVYSPKFRAIHPGIASTRIAQLREAASRTSDGGKHLVNVGSIHPRKNQMMTLRAFAQVYEDHPDARLDLVGPVKDEEYLFTLKVFVNRNGLDECVHFLGWRDDVPDLLGQSDGLILSSHREGVPNVVREAMFAEVPVIATAVGGVPEAVKDGETGFLVPPGGVDELGECIDYLLSHSNERERMGRRGLELAQRRFSREKWLSKYATVLHGLSHSSS